MPPMRRRDWLAGLGTTLVAAQARPGGAVERPVAACTPKGGALLRQDFQPETMLHVPETRVPSGASPARLHRPTS